jgi:hypothetical protein
VLALAIVGAMLAILFGGLRVGVRAWQRGEAGAEALQHSRSLGVLLEQALGGTHPYLIAGSAGVQPEVLFQGEPDRLAFATVSPPFPLPAPIAFTAVVFSIDGGRRPGFALRAKALPNVDPFEVEEQPPLVVDSTLTGVRFRYLRDVDGAWEDRWDGAVERAVPRAVEVTLTALIAGQPVEQPPITVPIRVTSP